MKKEENVLVNVSNDFYQARMDELVRLLKEGKGVGIYVDCIGHTRNQMVTAKYLNELENIFGERLKKREERCIDYYYLD